MNLPFEGDTFIKAELIKLRDKFNLAFCVETGTQYGSTTLELHDVFGHVFTIEADENNFNYAKKRFDGIGSIVPVFGKSEYKLPGVFHNDNTLIYLDAHGGEPGGCPLKKELSVIASKNRKNICIAIHDFKVPGTDFGYDTYDYELCFEEIEPYLNMVYRDGFDYHYNTEADGARRGIIYIYPKNKI